jgi:putative acetyltransferase
VTLALRPLAAGDVDGLTALWVAAWQITMPDIDFEARGDWLRERLATHRSAGVAVICAEDADGLAGFVTVDSASGHIDQLAVAPRCFGTGAATALLAEARRRSPAGLHLEVNQENPRAVRFYQREGFAITGVDSIGVSNRPTWLMHWRPTIA